MKQQKTHNGNQGAINDVIEDMTNVTPEIKNDDNISVEEVKDEKLVNNTDTTTLEESPRSRTRLGLRNIKKHQEPT